MEVRLLGPLEVGVDGQPPFTIPGAREAVVLAALAVAGGTTLSADRLVDEIWGDDPPASAAKTLQNVVLRLRRALTPAAPAIRVETRPGGYGLALDGATVDLHRAEALVREADRAATIGDHGRRAELLTAALGLWRGEPLSGFEDRPFAATIRSRLAEVRLRAMEQRLDALLASDRVGEAVVDSEDYVRREPLHEPFHRHRMAALARAGREADALRVAHDFRTSLADETGLEASPALTELERAILAQDLVPANALPSGRVTFLFTDVEASTEWFRRLGDRWIDVVTDLAGAIRGAVKAHAGTVVSADGDSVFAAFTRAADAVAAAVALQRAALERPAIDGDPVLVRVGIHSGDATPINGAYIALPVHQAARTMGAAHGGQILVSGASASEARADLPPDVRLDNVGRYQLRSFPEPEALFQVRAAGVPAAFPPVRALAVLEHNLPEATTTFVGRDEECTEVATILRGSRLVTIAGPGGVGKTRLALEVARRELDRYADGAWLVELAPVPEAALVEEAVARTLGTDLDAAGVAAALRHRRLLLVLDNCEHVLEGAASLAAAIGTQAPGVRVLATSREPLDLDIEAVWRLAPLPFPRRASEPRQLESYDSVQLFAARARATDPSFALDASTAPVVAEVVAALDGLPLAIELAAPVAATIGLEELRAGLADRLDLLDRRGRGPADRHRGLRATLEWSHGLLSDAERALYRRLGCFAGSFDHAAAAAVAGFGAISDTAVRRLLGRLVHQSFVSRAADGRFHLLETMRLHASEKLADAGEGSALARRHADWVVASAMRLAPSVDDPTTTVAACAELAQLLDDIRIARDHLLDAAPEDAVRLVAELQTYWDRTRRWVEQVPVLEAALATGALAPYAQALAVEHIGHVRRQFDLAEGRDLLLQAAERYRKLGAAAEEARAMTVLANIEANSGDLVTAGRYAEAAFELRERLGDRPGALAVGKELVTIALYAGAYEIVVDLAQHFAQDPAAGLDDVIRFRGLAAVALRYLGRATEARAAALEAARLGWETRVEDDWEWWGVGVLGEMLTYAGETEAAAIVNRWTLDMVLDFNPGGLIDTLHLVAHSATIFGRHELAAELLGAADAACKRMGLQLSRGLSWEWEEQIVAVREVLGAGAFHEAWTRGSRIGDVAAAMRAHALLDEIAPSSRRHGDDAIAALLA